MIEDIVQMIRIRAPIERVWQVLTTEGMVEQWLGCIGYRADPGHVFHMQPDPAKRAVQDLSGATHCELIALDPPREMRFSWYFPNLPRTQVAIRLSEVADGTLAELVHGGWEQFDESEIRAVRDALADGWSSHVMPNLKSLSERVRVDAPF